MAHYRGNIALCKNNAEMCTICAEMCKKIILAKKRIFDAPNFFFLLFSFQKWIPLEKLDIKHVLYDFVHAIRIIFKGVKKNVSIALSNYTRNSCATNMFSTIAMEILRFCVCLGMKTPKMSCLILTCSFGGQGALGNLEWQI